MAEVVERLNAALEGRYSIERPVGEGGMAIVYLARDLRHERKVALKVLKPELAALVGAERFLAEIKTTANLQHPHILPLFDSGEADGFLFYAMPYLAGETLHDRLESEERFPVDEAIRITVAVAHALETAHEAGVIHRDIKPGNILLSRGEPFVTDFGIALTLNTLDGRLTRTGGTVGSPLYMAPEQASGDYEVDARSDVYSLACVLYALLAGEAPHAGSTYHVILAKKLTRPPTPLRAVRPDVPEQIDRSIARALRIDPQDRHASVGEFAREIQLGLSTASATIEDTPWGAPITRLPEPPPTMLTRRTRLVGRQHELDTLRRHLDGALAGQGSFVLVGGEPGVGKTRLVEELLAEAMHRGALVVVGRCTEMDATSPYTPIVEQLDYALRLVPHEDLKATLGDGAPEIARLLPRLRRIFPDLPPATDLPPDVQRRTLFQHYRDFMQRASTRRPIVALFDDLQWSDETTLLLLEYLAQHLSGMSVLNLGTYRTSYDDPDTPWGRALTSLTRQRLAARVALGPMAREDVSDLLTELGGSPPPDEVVRALFERTEGNPFFIEEVFQHLREEGLLLDPEGAWRTDFVDRQVDVPPGVRFVIQARLESLSAATRKALAPAAIIGRRFHLPLLEELEVLDLDELLDALDEAEDARLVSSDSSGREVVYQFTHELIRQTLLSGISGPRRQRWHREIADGIKRAYPKHFERRAPDIAYHLYEAGRAADAGEARAFCIMAAQQALDGVAFQEALTHVKRAYSLDEDELPGPQRLILERIRAAALWGMGIGSWPEAVQTLLGALELAESLQDGPAIVETSIAVNFGLLAMDDHAGARDTARRGLAALGDAVVPARALLLAKLGLAEGFNGFDAGSQAIEQAEAVAVEIGDPLTLGRVLSEKAAHLLSWGRPLEAIEQASRSQELVDLTSDPMIWIINESNIVAGKHVTGLSPDILPRTAELMRESERLGNLYGLIFGIRAQMDMALYVGGDWKTYEELCHTAAELHAVFPSVAGRGQIFFALCELNRGNAQKAYEMVLDGVARSSSAGAWSPSHYGLSFWHAVRARASDTDKHARTVLDTLPDPSEPVFIGWYESWMPSVEAFARLGRVDEAASLRPHMATASERGWRIAGAGGGLLSFTCEGIAAAAAGDWDAAERHYGEAERYCGDGMAIFAARNRYWRAWTKRRRGEPGDADEARGLLEEAREAFGGLGMSLDVSDVEAELAALDYPGT